MSKMGLGKSSEEDLLYKIYGEVSKKTFERISKEQETNYSFKTLMLISLTLKISRVLDGH